MSQASRGQLRRKEIWVAGSDRYRNPEVDLPQDFGQERETQYAVLRVPRDSGNRAGTEDSEKAV